MTTFGVGIGNFFGGSLIKLTGSEVPSIALSATSRLFRKSLPFADNLGVVGQMFLSYGFLAYLAIITGAAGLLFPEAHRGGPAPAGRGRKPLHRGRRRHRRHQV